MQLQHRPIIEPMADNRNLGAHHIGINAM